VENFYDLGTRNNFQKGTDVGNENGIDRSANVVPGNLNEAQAMEIGSFPDKFRVQGQHFTGLQLLTEDREFVLGGDIHRDLQRVLGKGYPVNAISSITFTD